jgi:hypothetical protein
VTGQHATTVGLALLLAACSGEPPAPTSSEQAAQVVISEAAPPANQAPAKTAVSQYTSLKDCKVTELREDEGWSVSRCAGPGGYDLFVDYDDARDDLRLKRPGGKPIELGLLQLNGGGASADGKKQKQAHHGLPFRQGSLGPSAILRACSF